jgi:integrase
MARQRHKRVCRPVREQRGNSVRWRVRIVDERGVQRVVNFGSEAEAQARYEALVFTAGQLPAGMTQGQALELYHEHLKLRAAGKVAGRRISDVTVNSFLIAARPWVTDGAPVSAWTREAIEARYVEMVDRLAAGTHHTYLRGMKLFCRWLVSERHLRRNPTEDIAPRGTPNRGKPQLNPTEAAAYLATAFEAAAQGDEGAVAAAMPVSMYLGAREVLERRVADFDPVGLLFVRAGKTENRKRTVPVPAELMGPLRELCRGKLPGAFIFDSPRAPSGHREVQWLNAAIERFCDRAGVQRITSHGGRGTCSSLSSLDGMPLAQVAQRMGHGSTTITAKHYLAPGVKERSIVSSAARVIEMVRGSQSGIDGSQSEKASG